MNEAHQLMSRLSSEVFHETVDSEGDFGGTLDAFADGLTPGERSALRDELSLVARMSPEDRILVLAEIRFAWEFEDEAGFFAALSRVFDEE